MTDDVRGHRHDDSLEGAPTWLRAVQAGLIGVVAGLALHTLLSLVVLHGETPAVKQPGPSQCKKSSPARTDQPPVEPRGMGQRPADRRIGNS